LELVKPPRLRKGQKIGIVALAGPVEENRVQTGMKSIIEAGFEVELSPGIHERNGYFAGSSASRAKDLENFFKRSDISAIFCARGGFGSVQLLPLLHAHVIRSNPKIFLGYSDISLLLSWMQQSSGVVTFHGPMVAVDFARGLSQRAADYFWPVLLGQKQEWKAKAQEALRPGKAEAPLIGGCLSALVTTLGTPYEIETQGRILFLEDVAEKPYRIERMLTHLQMAGKLDRLAGLILGDFVDCADDGERGLKEIFIDLFHRVPYPVLSGFPAGHGQENLLLPLGVKMSLDSEACELSLLDSPVRP